MGWHSVHTPRDGHKCLDACLQLGHATPSLTALTALLPSLLPYIVPMLRLSEAVPAFCCQVPSRGWQPGTCQQGGGTARYGMGIGCDQHSNLVQG